MRRCLTGVVLVAALAAHAAAQPPEDPVRALDRSMAEADASLKAGELELAESRYRDALRDGWMLAGAIHAAEANLDGARDAFRRATRAAVSADAAFRALALVHLQLREPGEAVTILSGLVGRHPRDVPLRQMLTQALLAAGQPEQAVQELEEASAAAPGDPEIAFLLASGYLRLGKVDAADRLFAEVAKARPLPETDVLIGRTYRDAGEYARARRSLRAALARNPRVRRAHYYLGTTAVLEEGVVRLDEAIAEFGEELKLAPGDPITTLRLGMALVEAQRPAEALPHLQQAASAETAPADAFHYLGRCLVALDRPAEAVPPLERALARSAGPVVDDLRLLGIHYQLALALRALGRRDEAAAQFAAAERLSATRAASARERLAHYMGDGEGAEPLHVPLPTPVEVNALAAWPAADRGQLQRRVHATIARASLNLGVLHAQAERFARAATLFEEAAAADAAFPGVQHALGVAYFTSQQYERALDPLARELAASPGRAEVRRMLAVAALNAGRFEQAAALLADDAARADDPSLQYAYGVALVRSNQAELAESVFARLVAAHGEVAELRVVLGHAHAQQGDYEAAVAELTEALRLDPEVADASAALGLIYLKQGKLADAAAALRRELSHHPHDRQAAHTLATVLDLEGQHGEAAALLRSLLAASPQYADARYLLGKVLLAQGATHEALAQLEAAARLAPDDANVHYQLAQAYQKAGMPERAAERFEIFRQLKDRRRVP